MIMKNKKILLVEPDYKTEFKPLGLMRISAYHKNKGDYVEFVKGEKKINFIPDKIYITTLFTYKARETLRTVRYYRKEFPNVEIWAGGIMASLHPDLFKKEGVYVHFGIWKEVEDFPPDYSLFPDLDYSITFTSRGCVNKCGFCVVPVLEGDLYSRPNWINDINLKFPKIYFFDNNWLAKPKEELYEDIRLLHELKKKGIKEIDFNQSLDCRKMDEDIAKRLKGLNINPMRFSFDHLGQDKFAQNAIKLSKKYGFAKIHIDVLYNWTDTIEDFYYRLKEICRLGASAILMKYAPIHEINRDYVGENWTKKERNAVNKINPYPYGQISSKSKEEFEYFFGKNWKEFKKLLNYPNIKKLNKLKFAKMNKEKIWKNTN